MHSILSIMSRGVIGANGSASMTNTNNNSGCFHGFRVDLIKSKLKQFFSRGLAATKNKLLSFPPLAKRRARKSEPNPNLSVRSNTQIDSQEKAMTEPKTGSDLTVRGNTPQSSKRSLSSSSADVAVNQLEASVNTESDVEVVVNEEPLNTPVVARQESLVSRSTIESVHHNNSDDTNVLIAEKMTLAEEPEVAAESNQLAHPEQDHKKANRDTLTPTESCVTETVSEQVSKAPPPPLPDIKVATDPWEQLIKNISEAKKNNTEASVSEKNDHKKESKKGHKQDHNEALFEKLRKRREKTKDTELVYETKPSMPKPVPVKGDSSKSVDRTPIPVDKNGVPLIVPPPPSLTSNKKEMNKVVKKKTESTTAPRFQMTQDQLTNFQFNKTGKSLWQHQQADTTDSSDQSESCRHCPSMHFTSVS